MTNSGGNIDLRNAEFSATLPIVGLRIDSQMQMQGMEGAFPWENSAIGVDTLRVTELRVDSHSSGSGNHGVTDFTKQAILSWAA
ncbi:MAG: hypothetical protein R3C56_19490 [Pirellulaceae bacterium]